MVVLVAVLAIAAGVVLAWAALRGEPADSGAAPAIDGISGVVDTAAPPPVEVPSPSVPPPPSGSGGAAVDSAAGIAFVATYDPLGDGVENDEQVGFAADGDPTTVWSTVCYESEYLGAKGGVGLVTTFTGTAPGRLEIDLPAGPWAVEVRTVAADTYPASLDGWGEVVAAANANGAETMSVPLIAAARHALVWFRQLPADPDCSGDNPHRASVSEIRFSPNG